MVLQPFEIVVLLPGVPGLPKFPSPLAASLICTEISEPAWQTFAGMVPTLPDVA